MLAAQWLRAAVTLGALLVDIESSSMYMARLCLGQRCDDMKHPILDWDEAKQTCVCRAHPCWDDNGLRHQCEDRKFPHLEFYYEKDLTLKCRCSSKPTYASPHVMRVKCPGHHCNNDSYPVLDVLGDQCMCRKHPCDDIDGRPGMLTVCNDPQYPILVYRMEKGNATHHDAHCDCMKRMAWSHDEL
eukprot:gnl/TRDRNA2_/TRDRNA2_125674_c0_seq2.p1 gnl/TRDRNA2_/TRDRNA2_125674_c0~~gnl/TRDRNA2_/TRDRNA2_125674_c0_seq2.p1  ORF type:complete len:186 (+),score=16.52 gnl/TRDRNA2_/TRDRNA2_125674_c0_seq2:119-676(+)